MQIRIGLENEIEGRSLAWVLDYPGCFAYGRDGTEAILRVPQAVITFREWAAENTTTSWLQDLGDFDIALTEIFECYKVIDNGREIEINAWFQDDLRSLSKDEIERGIALLEWSSTDLKNLVAHLTSEQLNQKFTNERWSISGVVQHVAKANWWYLDRLGLTNLDLSKYDDSLFERLDMVQQELLTSLPKLVGKSSKIEVNQETWSPRKVLRRAIWHMRDHYFHIERLLTLL
jgi:hypothetical protein